MFVVVNISPIMTTICDNFYYYYYYYGIIYHDKSLFMKTDQDARMLYPHKSNASYSIPLYYTKDSEPLQYSNDILFFALF